MPVVDARLAAMARPDTMGPKQKNSRAWESFREPVVGTTRSNDSNQSHLTIFARPPLVPAMSTRILRFSPRVDGQLCPCA